MINSNQYKGQDWPNLNRYQQENEHLQPIKKGEKRVVFMGNSITEFWSSYSDFFKSNKNYINRGISGQTSPQMLLRFRQDVINLSPKLVVILSGINDIAENTGPSSLEMIENNIISMAELAKKNDIKVILCSVLPAAEFPWSPSIEPAKIVVDLNKKIKSFANQNNITYVDYFSEMKNENNGMRSDLANDGIHPNELGYSIMEPIIEKAIQKTLEN
ncbi:MAG: SGNH/GDSL hydrolase family protein [Parvicellaceae bacterium]